MPAVAVEAPAIGRTLETVATFFFGLIKHSVGLFDQSHRLALGLRHDAGDTQTDRHVLGSLRVLVRNLQLPDRLLKLGRNVGGAARVGVGQEADELFSTVAPHEVVCATDRGQSFPYLPEDFISGDVSVVVVVLFETVDVQHHQR